MHKLPKAKKKDRFAYYRSLPDLPGVRIGRDSDGWSGVLIADAGYLSFEEEVDRKIFLGAMYKLMEVIKCANLNGVTGTH